MGRRESSERASTVAIIAHFGLHATASLKIPFIVFNVTTSAIKDFDGQAIRNANRGNSREAIRANRLGDSKKY